MSRRLKVTLILAQDAMGGTESQLVTLVDKLVHFCDINIWILKKKNEQQIIKRKLNDCKNVDIYYGKNIFVIHSLVQNTDIIYSCIINYYWPEIILKLLSKSVLLTARRNTYHWRNFGKIYFNEMIRNLLTSKVICNSEIVENKYYETEKVLPPSVVIHNGFNLVQNFMKPQFLVRKFICVANIKAGKGYETVSKLLAEKYLPHKDLQIFGRVDDINLASNLPPETLMGLRDKQVIYSKHCYMLHLSEAEGFPNVIIEALENGIMPIISNIDIHRNLFSEVAIIIDNYEDLVKIIREIYDGEQGMVERTQTYFENYVQLRKKFSSDLYAEKFYTELINANLNK